MILERYELVREIGRGGTGAVWLATDHVLGREVAIKRIGLLPGAEDADLPRAEREARLAAKLNHPHVIAVYDLVEEDGAADGSTAGEHWLIMEYIEGIALSGLVRRDGPLTPDEAASLLSQTADALAAAHAAGIVHRDVKPSNILVTPDGQAKLGDFGIARAEADATLTQTGLVTGSPAYLAPEVASGGLATPASDVWALGATLFHALEGSPPYETGDNLMGALYRIVHEEPPRPRNAQWLTPVLEATMTRDPLARWDMARVRDFLAQGGHHVTVTPAPPTAEDVAVPSSSTVALAPVPVERPEPGTTGGRGRQPVDPLPRPVAIAPEPGERTRRRRSVLPLILVGMLVAALLIGALLWGFLQPGDGGRQPIGASASHSGAGRSSTSAGPSGSASDSPSSSASGGTGGSSQPAAQPTVAGMRSFITQYLADAPNEPESTYRRLTPAFQQDSGGLDNYSGYWRTIDSATLTSFEADPAALTVHYTLDYVRTNGSTATGDVRLQLAFENGKYLIAAES